MTILKDTPEKQLKQRYLDIYSKYSSNIYYIDSPKLFTELAIVFEDFPETFAKIINDQPQYLNVKDWVQGLFIVTQSTVFQLTLENKIQFIMNNITKLPFCKCKVKLRLLEEQEKEA